MFNQADLNQFKKKQIPASKVEEQINQIRKGFPFINIIKPATNHDGILILNDEQINRYIKLYEKNTDHEEIVKFVPASGAASRMFKSLYEYLEDSVTIPSDHFDSHENFFKHLEDFAFHNDLMKYAGNINPDTQRKEIINLLLNKEGLNYGNLPKGLLKFHKSPTGGKTPFEEHLSEGALYTNSNKKVRINFTVSPEHIESFIKLFEKVKKIYEDKYSVSFIIDFTLQKESTDTVAVDMNNQAFRNTDGSILFRPGGHGALIENLNDIKADIIFIKNIDNVVPDKRKPDTVKFKKMIAGLLIETRQRTFELIRKLESDDNRVFIDEAKLFLEKTFKIELDREFSKRTDVQKINYLISKLNRPIRVCGMVKNEGEPGGGPFYVQKESGSVSLQIVEGAQINLNDQEKASIVKQATHFNPVDLVLSVKDYKGQPFNLTNYIDPDTGFISVKSKDGKQLKAMELPGLWNGAMANWNTVFVEVPISTFNPVKTVNDLLREAHVS